MKKTILIYIVLSSLALTSLYAQNKKLVILHSNDTHSRIEPLPKTDRRYPNVGGVANRKAVIDSIRQAEENVLLLDAGDFVQGTPYFNLFGGRVETQALNMLGYEVGTLGNHEFDNGLDLLKMMIELINYPIVCCNYDFTQTVLKGMIEPYLILDKEGIKIGIIGVGVNPEGLIQADKYKGMRFKPIIETTNYFAKILRETEKCDLVIALTHIGIGSDIELAESSENIDLIIGGHSHTFLDDPVIKQNMNKQDVLIHQAGDRGSFLGEIELILEKHDKN